MSTAIALGPTFQALIQAFFTSYLVDQRAVSPRTVTTYRDAFTLLLEHAERALGKAPAALALADIDETLILGFLDELETRRGNAVRTRNARLAAIRSFLQFATRRDVANLATTTAALSVPMKRFERPIFGFLSREQMLAVLDLPGTDWLATRDRVLLHLLYNSGARVSELVAIRVNDVITGDGACVSLARQGPQTADRATLEKHRQACVRLARARRRASRQRAATANAQGGLHDASERRAATRDRGEARG